jgi:ADP-ribose pyrophosphatase YjhB (NUDIX family)
MEWMPILTYLFANVCLVTKDGRVILVLTEERKAKNIWVIPGGEIWYKSLETFFSAVAREAGKEELGIILDPARIKIFDAQIGYPIKDSPYEDKGITSVIVSYVYPITEGELNKITVNAVIEKGCNIVDFIVKPVSDVLADIDHGVIKVYPALEETLNKLKLFLQEGS